MFDHNKYYSWYINIISSAKSRNWSKTTAPVYVENHHIIPKSMGGDNTKNNMVLLTAKEHYICHLLLIRFTHGANRSKMIYAYISMSRMKHDGMFRITPSSRCYKSHREEYYKLLKLRKGAPGPNLGKKFSSSTKQKMADAKLGLKFPKSHRENLSLSQKNRYLDRPKGYSCIRCEKSFPGSNANKHFNVCYRQ